MEPTERLRIALLEFVERASKKDATPEEVQALPKVAEALLMLLGVTSF